MSLEVGIKVAGLSIFSNRKRMASGLKSESPAKAACYLDSVDFSLKKDEKAFLRSATGREKVAIIRCLAGMIPIAEGTIEIQGKIFPGIVPSFGMMPRATMQQNAMLRGIRLGFAGGSLKTYCEKIFSDPHLARHREADLIDVNKDTTIAFWLATLAEIKPEIFLVESWMNPVSKELRKRCRELFIRLVEESDVAVMAIDNVQLASSVSNVELEFDDGTIRSTKRHTSGSQ